MGASTQVLLPLREGLGLLGDEMGTASCMEEGASAGFERWARIGMVEIWEMASQDGDAA